MNTDYTNRLQREYEGLAAGTAKLDQLKSGHSYLIRERDRDSIVKMIVKEVTNTCYKIGYENEYNAWVIKSEFESKYIIIEDLGNKQLADIKSNMYRK